MSADQKTVTKAVRQVLFNEIGLTKQEVDHVIDRIVHQQIAEYVANRQGLGALIEQIVHRELRRYKDLTAEVTAEVRRIVAQHVAEHLAGRLTVEIGTKPFIESASAKR